MTAFNTRHFFVPEISTNAIVFLNKQKGKKPRKVGSFRFVAMVFEYMAKTDHLYVHKFVINFQPANDATKYHEVNQLLNEDNHFDSLHEHVENRLRTEITHRIFNENSHIRNNARHCPYHTVEGMGTFTIKEEGPRRKDEHGISEAKLGAIKAKMKQEAILVSA